MDDTYLSGSAEIAFWPRVTVYDGRSIEKTLAPATLFAPGLRLTGAVVEAPYAATAPPLLDRLREAQSPFLIDPCSLRFTTETYLGVKALKKLPYSPEVPIAPESDVESFVREALAFQASVGASAFVTPCVQSLGRSQEWLDLNHRIIDRATRIVGVELDRRPLVALVAPDWSGLREPGLLLDPLQDIPIEAIYVQPTTLQPSHDSIEKLVKYVRFLREAAALNIPVIAGRVGAFGLVLQALGIPFFDSGLGEAESFNLAGLNRPRRPSETSSGGGRKRRIYLAGLKSTLIAGDVNSIFQEPELRSRFLCQLECCRWTGWEGIADRRRPHYLHTRVNEVAQLAALPTQEMRLHQVHQQLLHARDNAKVVSRMLHGRDVNPPDLDHIERWLAVLSRIAGVSVAA